jgi:hypothetical protein
MELFVACSCNHSTSYGLASQIQHSSSVTHHRILLLEVTVGSPLPESELIEGVSVGGQEL